MSLRLGHFCDGEPEPKRRPTTNDSTAVTNQKRRSQIAHNDI